MTALVGLPAPFRSLIGTLRLIVSIGLVRIIVFKPGASPTYRSRIALLLKKWQILEITSSTAGRDSTHVSQLAQS